MSKSNKFSPEVRERAVRMVQEQALCRFVWKRFASCRHGWRERTGRQVLELGHA